MDVSLDVQKRHVPIWNEVTPAHLTSEGLPSRRDCRLVPSHGHGGDTAGVKNSVMGEPLSLSLVNSRTSLFVFVETSDKGFPDLKEIYPVPFYDSLLFR